jgi:uncharacterized protein YceK
MKMIYVSIAVIILMLTGCTSFQKVQQATDMRNAQMAAVQQELNDPNAVVLPIKTSGAKVVDLKVAVEAVMLGTSHKEDVERVLGKTKILSFDSKYEVWVYQYIKPEVKERPPLDITKDAKQKPNTVQLSELKILFNPAGIATKLSAQ